MSGRFIYNEDNAELLTLLQKPISFLVVGKPNTGKTTLATALAHIWKCKLVEPDSVLQETLSLVTESKKKIDEGNNEQEAEDNNDDDNEELDENFLDIFSIEDRQLADRKKKAEEIKEILVSGAEINENVILDLLFEKLNSPEVQNYGFVLDGFPSFGSLNWNDISKQLAIMNEKFPNKADYIIHVKIHDDDVINNLTNIRFDTETGKSYSKRFYEPKLYLPKKIPPIYPHPKKNDPQDGDEDNEDDDYDGNASNDGLGSENEITSDDTPLHDFSHLELEDSKTQINRMVFNPNNTDPKQILSQFEKEMLAGIEALLDSYGKTRIIEVNGLLSPIDMLKSITEQLSCFPIQTSIVPQLIFHDDESAGAADDFDAMDDDDFFNSLRSLNNIHPNCKWRISKWGRACPVALKSGKIINGKQAYSISFLDKMYSLSSERALNSFMKNPRKYLLPPQPALPCKLSILGPPCSGVTSLTGKLAEYYEAYIINPTQLIIPLLKKALEEEADIAANTASEDKLKYLKQQQLQLNETNEDEDDDNIVPEIDLNHPEVLKAADDARSIALTHIIEPNTSIYVAAINQALIHIKEQRTTKGEPADGGWILEGFPENRKQWTALQEAKITPEQVIYLKDSEEDGKRLLLRAANKFGLDDPFLSANMEEDEDKSKIDISQEDRTIEQVLADKEKSSKSQLEEIIIMPPQLEDVKNRREEHNTAFKALYPMLKSANIEPVQVDCHMPEDEMSKIVLTELEKVFQFKPQDYMPEDADERDDDPLDNTLTPQEIGIFSQPNADNDNTNELMDLKCANEKKPLGESQHFCPVALRETNILYPGKAEFAVKFRERLYLLSTEEAKKKFTSNINDFLDNSEPFSAPPFRLFLLGPRFSGKTTVGSQIAKELGVFFISYHEWLQQIVMPKLYKKPPLIDEEDLEDNTPDNTNTLETKDNSLEVSEPKVSEHSIHSESGSKSEIETQEKSTDELAEKSAPAPTDPLELDNTEEAIQSNLMERASLPETVLEWVVKFWQEEPYKSQGFILEGFPRTSEEAQFLIDRGLFADGVAMMKVSDEDILKRVLPRKLDIWKRKRQKEKDQYEKKLNVKKTKLKENIEKHQNEVKAELAGKREQLLADHEKRRQQVKEGEDDDDDDIEDELQNEIEAVEEELIEKLKEAEDEQIAQQSDDEELEQEPFVEAEERMRSSLLERYEAELKDYQDVEEIYNEANVKWVDLQADRKIHSIQRSLRKAFESYTIYRKALFTRVTPIEINLAHQLINNRYKQLSHYGWACPVRIFNRGKLPCSVDCAAIFRSYIYFFSSRQDRSQFKLNPMRYVTLDKPGPLVPLQISLVGGPLSGKSKLAERIANEFGCINCSAGKVLRYILTELHYCSLAISIEEKLSNGDEIPINFIVKAIEIYLLHPTAVRKGFVLDSFPVSKSQLESLLKYQILPSIVIELANGIAVNLKRSNIAGKIDIPNQHTYLPFHNSHNALKDRMKMYLNNIEAIRKHYSEIYYNYHIIDAQMSAWNVWNEAKGIIANNYVEIQNYIENISIGKPAPMSGLCFTQSMFCTNIGEFKHYCPVSLVDNGALIDCSQDKSLKFAVQYKSRHYLFSGKSELDSFVSNPDKYLNAESISIIPKEFPKSLSKSEIRAKFPIDLDFNGYCPVTYVQSDKKYEGLVLGKSDYIVEYRGKFYSMQNNEKKEQMLRFPDKFTDILLPVKLPPSKFNLDIRSLPILGYLEQTLYTAINKALSALCDVKPKYPFLSPSSSAQIYIGLHLKAFNKKENKIKREFYKKKLENFLENCSLIPYLGNNSTSIHPNKSSKPIEFNKKLRSFLTLKAY